MIIMIRAIMFEDSQKYRDSIVDYFQDSDRVFLEASFANADNAVSQVKKYQPDVVLMDINMPGISGIEALKKIKAASPNTKILMLTSHDDDDKVFAAICNGASGYRLKNDNPDMLEKAVSDVEEFGGYMTPSIAAKVMQMFQHQLVKTQPDYAALTDRQKEVLSRLVQGMSYKMIAGDLDISYETVCDHIKSIYKKLHVNSASEAVREAIIRRIV
jgi:DNA-binding NarL/FixJ family response regulator